MDEAVGRAVLRRVFESAGLQITEDYSLGIDPSCRVGYEYLTAEAGDRVAVTPELVAMLEERMRAGDFFVLLVDEREIADERTLARAGERFLAELRARGRLERPVP
jgi:hypothetical protein